MDVISRTSHARGVLAAMVNNLVGRLPDAPTQTSRSIARAGSKLQGGEEDGGGGGSSSMLRSTAMEEYDN